jgi:5-formyltetrahydrofolate cyclo-ligase
VPDLRALTPPQAEIATIYPQPFDIPMHHIVTERGVRTR